MFYKLQLVFYKNKQTKASSIFEELAEFIRQLPDWKEKPSTWFIAHPTEMMVAIDNNLITEKANDYVSSMIAKKKNFNVVLADKNKDDSVLTVWLMNTPAISDNRYYLTLTIASLSDDNNKITFINLIKRIVKNTPWDVRYIMVDTEQYKMKQKSVFNDRVPVGWMLYLPKVIDVNDAINAFEIIYCSDNSGTIIVSKEIFNGNNQNDIAISNNIEIELAANGHLPLMTEL
ncbi:Imm52 family immunity protein [Buttiauxella massiliensis]|uniref:Imm52 family immunity protein n=1 Tax=Buttiauxella massiliensis TaxID=2831590 RepID=UPI00125FCBC7|nr:Imm52 family immunity protein [Buttiauxella massiliensis]